MTIKIMILSHNYVIKTQLWQNDIRYKVIILKVEIMTLKSQNYEMFNHEKKLHKKLKLWHDILSHNDDIKGHHYDSQILS